MLIASFLSRLYFTISLLICAVSTAGAQNYFEVPAIEDTAQFKKGIARTAWLLTSAKQQNPVQVRILVYGQSISVQDWWKTVKEFVEKKFPLARITFINKAIGGFSAERLKLTVENDVISFYPDLVLFHDYGNEADYESIIRIIRSKTTAEIAVQTDHMALQNNEWHDRHNNGWITGICSKYKLALIDVRNIWKAYLKENKLEVKALLSDGVHLNAHGNYLMASIINQYFNFIDGAKATNLYVQTKTAGKDFVVKRNKLKMQVNGNRIDLVWKPHSGGTEKNLVYIDGKKPSAFGTCYYYTRPAFDTNSFFLKKIGQLLALKLTDKAKEEKWMMTVMWADSQRQQIGYSLTGSLTGPDGSGSSDSLFVSRSGKIIIEPAFWFRAKEFAAFPWLKPGDVLRWEVRSMCQDEALPEPSEPITVAQGLNNGKHQILLKGKGLKKLEAIKIYQPPLQ
ncbi:MAG: SGNH/GDSL hydrolase family protein [Chitinophagaceae bacterium]